MLYRSRDRLRHRHIYMSMVKIIIANNWSVCGGEESGVQLYGGGPGCPDPCPFTVTHMKCLLKKCIKSVLFSDLS